MSNLADLADRVLEASVVLSFTKIGPQARSRLFDWTPAEELPRLDGKVVLVTGGTSGLGEAAAASMAQLGASVRLLARNPEKAITTIERIRSLTGNDDVQAGIADLANLDDVRRFTERFLAEHERLDVLVHSAGGLVHDYQRTTDGIELTAQTHVVAPFLLTRELMPLLQTTPQSRVVLVTSGGMYSEPLSTDDLEMPPDQFKGMTAYARAKRAQVALVNEWAHSTDRVAFHAMHPGWVDTPGVEAALPRFHRILAPLLRSPDEGADTIVWLATAEGLMPHSGSLWLDRRQRASHRLRRTRRPDEAAERRRLIDWCETKSAQPK